MTVENDDWKSITAYLSGNLSIHEKNQFEKWLAASQVNRDVFNDATKIWTASRSKTSLTGLSTEEEWLKLRSNISSPEKKINRWISSPYSWISLAACILLFIFVGRNLFFEKNNSPIINQKLTTLAANKEVITFLLPDGSKIWININSTISFPQNFLSERKINLEGEAFFNVRPDSLHPFVVKTSNSEVTVLGTTFNIKESKGQVSVVVADGKVKLKNINSKKNVTLIAGEMGETVGEKVVKTKNTNQGFDAWRKKNNSIYSEEVTNPLIYIIERHASAKNQINQTVIEGTIKNNASLASYENIELSLNYMKQNGKKVTSHLTVNDIIRPGEVITYRKKLFDIFTKNAEIKVKIEKIHPVN